MIESRCTCGDNFRSPEDQANFARPCRNCGALLTTICAEQLAEGAGAADFDALLVIESGPHRTGEMLFLGGVPNIEFGKLAGKHILLDGPKVSRNHGYLQRLDFGPSRWQLEDNRSTNGIYVNGQRISSHPLVDGDRITIGDYELIYRSMFDAMQANPPAATTSAAASLPAGAVRGVALPNTGGPICPSCDKSLAPNARICIACGINLKSGRPILTAKGMDENDLYARAETWIRAISWVVRFLPFPTPIASEAFGTRKPYAIWSIAALTTIASIIFFIAQMSSGGTSGRSLMLWPPQDASGQAARSREVVTLMLEYASPQERRNFNDAKRDLRGKVPDETLDTAAFEQTFGELPSGKQFHWWQLLTHALLHSPSGIFDFVMHLGGNLLFLLVFGTRVNNLIGDLATAIIYPLLAVASGLTQILMTNHLIPVPLLGASGAINGLAGMYLILFPVHRVYCAWWWRWGFIGKFHLHLKIFPIRGFWILLIYFAFDLLVGLLTRNSLGGGTAHWAHIGGFVTGACAAVGLLLSRHLNTRGGDLLSVALGKHAWPLLGKPSRWISQPPPVPDVRAVSLNYQG